MSDNTELLRSIDSKLAVLVKLEATTIAISSQLDTPKKIELLTSAGLSSTEIGSLLDIRADSVRHIRSSKPQKKAIHERDERTGGEVNG